MIELSLRKLLSAVGKDAANHRAAPHLLVVHAHLEFRRTGALRTRTWGISLRYV